MPCRLPRFASRLRPLVLPAAVLAVALPAPAQSFEPETIELTGTVRDFRAEHPDMQFRIAFDPGIVEPVLGDDGKPVYTKSRTTTATTNGRAFFDQWYRDVEGVNVAAPLTLPLTNSAGAPSIFTFDSGSFFPIDGQLFGNQGMAHNYYFTFELHSRFTYRGGEVFTFRGDDDVFVFVNGRLVIDIGGVHGPIQRSVSLDAVAGSIGLEPGGAYDFALFFAERFCCGSNFRIQTSIVLEQPPPNPCGNGVIDAGEQCDDGGREDGDGCSAVCEIEGLPPVASCTDAELFTDFGSCSAAASVDGGSFDPDGGALDLLQTPAGPFPPGSHAVALQTTDPDGATASCAATVTVLDREPPRIDCGAPAVLAGGGGPLTFTSTAADNCLGTAPVTVEVSVPVCSDEDLDDDGVPDGVDECPGSDLAGELSIGDCATGAENLLFASGCTFSDLVLDCAAGAATHGDFVSCVSHLTNAWVSDGLINGGEKGRIESCAARSPLPLADGLRTAGAALGAPCAATVEEAAVSVPEAPGIGSLTWSVRATDGFGNVTVRQCEVAFQDPDGPLPNLSPVADAGDGTTVLRHAAVQLDGTGSTDLDGDPLAFRWTLAAPPGSAAALSDPTSPAPTLVPDLAGLYRAELVVSDGVAESAPAAVEVLAVNSRPLADAGPDRTVFADQVATFDGIGSADPDADALVFAWTLAHRPEGSAAELSDPTAASPSLHPDLRGVYVARLVVADGELASVADAAILRVPNASPVADAGADREISVFDRVLLDGGASTDRDGDPLAFAWTLAAAPPGSAAELENADTATPAFVADLAGDYEVELVVFDGFAPSAPDRVRIVTVNTPPVAAAGPDRVGFLGEPVTLDGTGSADADGDGLTFAWSFVLTPPGSVPMLSDPTAAAPGFVPDHRGVYELELVVHDGQRPSRPDRVTVDVVNRAPTADAGPDLQAFVGDTVHLDGSGSTDLDGDALSFAWSFVSRPAGSAAGLSDPTAVAPSFVVDRKGDYVLELVVSDGELAGAPDRVTVSTLNARPVADAGPDESTLVGEEVALDGTGSSDPDGDPLAFSWTLIGRPEGSAAALAGAASATPLLNIDRPGTYVAELVVSDGELASEPDQVVVTTENSRPVADAGADVTVETGTLVALDGSGSSDADGDPLTHAWALTSVPAGSTASLSDPAAVSLTFVADLAGTYVAQLVVSDGELASEPDTVRVEAADALIEVPDVLGLARAEAEAAIVAAGLVVGTVTQTTSDTVPAGHVVDQHPAPGAAATAGAAVDLVLSIGPGDDGAPPLAAITAPAEDALVGGRVDVVGTASDPALLRYELAWAPTGSDEFVVFAEGLSPVVDGVLGTLDATLVPNGMLTLRLRVFDPTFVVTTTRVVRVDSQKKIGNFTISFNDVVLPVAGIPITVTRTYDSTVETREDFGVGWTLGVAQGDYVNNRIPGEGWQIVESGGIFSLPCQRVEETRGHVTEIRLSGAEAYYFKLDLVAPAPLLGGCQATARFVPLAGNLSAGLDILGDTEVLYLAGTDEVVDTGTFEPFEPTDVRLTTPDGRVVDLDLVSGITAIRDTNGTGIAIGPGGITHSGGSGIVFERDGLGRIARITRPDGESLVYTYDAAGDLVAVTDAAGAETRFAYDADHLLTELVDARGVPLVRNEYDADGRLIATVDAAGNRTEFEHDLAANREVYRDRLGHVQVFVYDDAGNVVSRTEQLGHTVTSTYDADGNLLTETDPLGHTTTLTYDADGNLLTETDPLGHTTTRTYHPLGLPLTVTDPLGHTTTHGYDSEGNLLSTTDPLGHTTTFTVDAAGSPLTATDPLGFVTTWTYDADGRVTSVTDGEGNVVTTTHDDAGNPLTESRTRTVDGTPVVETASFAYDAEGRVISRTDRTGATESFEYDPVGQIAARIDARGNRVEMSYDFHGNLAEIRYPDGTRESFEHDAEGRKIAVTDRAGRTTRFERDAAGRVIATTFPDGAVERVGYDALGRRVTETDGNGHTTTYAYDAAGRVVAVTDPLGNVTERTYDAAGNKLTETDANGRVTRFEYDAAGRLTATVRPDGSRVTFTYDAVGNKLTETDAAGCTTAFAYDGVGRLIRVTDALGGVTGYGYDEAGDRTSITDANGHTTSFRYDAAGREIGRTLPVGQESSRAYDAAGNLVRTVDANGDVVTFAYDAANRLVRRTLPDGTVEELTYTPTGQVATRTDAHGVTTFTYDARDRLLRQDDPDGSFLAYTYDAAGNRTSTTTPAGTTVYTHDAGNRLTTVVDAGGGVTTYAYDAVGNLAGAVLPNGTRTVYTYDALNRLVRLENLRADGTAISAYTYTLGPAGNRVRVVESSGRTVDYEYDALYRLTRETISGPEPRIVEYTYDAVGNRLTRRVDGGAPIVSSYDDNDRLLAAGATTYAYDPAGHLISRSGPDGAATYEYDGLGRLVRSVDPDGVVELAYDMAGNRVRRTVDGVVTRFLVDADREHAQVVEERDAAGALVAAYTHGLDLLRQVRAGVVSYYHHDGVGSVRALTDATGAVTDTYDYDAFGELLASTGDTANDYRFTGEQLDPNLGFYYLRARYYDPSSGRFTSADVFPPNLFDPETLHRYAYVANDPVNRVDPSGQFATAAGLMTTVSIGQMLDFAAPTFIQGAIVMTGVQVFMKPGFELRNLGLEALQKAQSAQATEYALDIIRSGHQIIRLGADFIGDATDAVDLVGLGFGVADFARSINHLPFRTVAGQIESEGLTLFQLIRQNRSFGFLRSLHPRITDWSEVIAEGLGVLRDIEDQILDEMFGEPADQP